MALSVSFTGVVALIWAFTGVSLPIGGQPSVETASVPFSGFFNQAKQEWQEVKTALSGTEEAAGVITTEEATAVDPRDLTLTTETLSDVDTSLDTTWVETSSTSTQSATTTPSFQAVQIVTRPAATSTATTASSLPE